MKKKKGVRRSEKARDNREEKGKDRMLELGGGSGKCVGNVRESEKNREKGTRNKGKEDSFWRESE